MTLLIAEDVNLLRGTFQVGEMSIFLAVGWILPPLPTGVSHKSLGGCEV